MCDDSKCLVEATPCSSRYTVLLVRGLQHAGAKGLSISPLSKLPALSRQSAEQKCTADPSVTVACSLQVLRAIKDGYDCRGIYIWTLVNNFVSTCCCPEHMPLA